jgi:hypothetical protein
MVTLHNKSLTERILDCHHPAAADDFLVDTVRKMVMQTPTELPIIIKQVYWLMKVKFNIEKSATACMMILGQFFPHAGETELALYLKLCRESYIV